MTDKVAVQLVNVRTLKIVKLLTFKAEDLVVHDYGYMDAFAVEYIAVHDRPPVSAKAARRQIARSNCFPFAFSPARPRRGIIKSGKSGSHNLDTWIIFSSSWR